MNDKTENNTNVGVKQFAIKGTNKPPYQAIERFLDALKTNHVIKAKAILNSFPELATLRGNFFHLPLLVAGLHENIQLINDLLEKGACPHLAIRQPLFKKLPEKSKQYLEMICNFRKGILEQIHGLH